MAHLIMAVAGGKRKIPVRTSVITFGRDPDNEIVIYDPSASGKHCRITKTPKGYLLEDLGSEHGTWVNGKRIASKLLQEKDVIRVGEARMALRGLSPAPGAASGKKGAAPAAAEPAETAASRRRASARRPKGAKGKTSPPLEIKPEYAAASERETERLIRRGLREGSKIPAWLLALILCIVLAVALALLWIILGQSRPSPEQEALYRKAQAFEEQHDYETAAALYGQIPEDDPSYGEQARLKRETLLHELDAVRKQQDNKKSKELYEFNILGFIHKYLDAPADKPGLEERIKDLAEDRASFIRVLIRNRIDPFLEEYPDVEDAPAVRALREKYLKEWDESAPPTFRDIEIESETWMLMDYYGKAYQVLAQWERDHPYETKNADRIERMKRRIRDTFDSSWAIRSKDLPALEAAGNYKAANKIYYQFLNRCKGYDLPEIEALRAEWKRKFDENEKLLLGK